MNAVDVMLVADRGPVRTLTLNRPDRFNALDEALLDRLVGREQALRLYLLGETWDAPTAERRGLVGQVVPDDELEAAVATLADRLAAQAPLAVARMKHHFNTAERAGFADMLQLEAEGMIELAGTADFKEGLAAFTDRRPPHFEGR